MKVTSSQVIPKMKRKSVRRNFGHNAKNESKRNLLQQPRLVDPPGNCMALKVLAVIILVLFVAPLSFTSIPGFIAEGPGLSSEVGGVAAPPPQTCAMPVEELDIGEQIAQRSRIQPENEDNSDIFSNGIWKERSLIKDGSLRSLASDLHDFVLKSRADSTSKVYQRRFKKWVEWCSLYPEITPIPAKEFHVALYLKQIAESSKSSTAIDQVFYAIGWAHDLAGLHNPCKSAFVNHVREAARRQLKTSVIKKEPLTPEHLKSLVSNFAGHRANLSDLRLVTLCLLGYSAFLRFSEICNIRRSDLMFFESHMNINIPKSKTDIYREGNTVSIAKLDSQCCPVSMTLRYLQLAEIPHDSSEFIFRSLSFCPKSNSYKLRGTSPLSYTRAREVLLEKLSSIGLDPSKFCLHSLRSGGASAAANCGVSDRLFKAHGRWRSETAKDGYVKDKLESKLFVSKNLGL
ncbi:integrase/recombinase xerD homolog isoform X1 [Pecten maximus]|uniref:integrase/recombinase xerD homolog isoform X1 n=1 Tax=Pecten maximus TaxID=6579 RepID=UPI001458AFED|nr:integrase/recombinase xerD homolog isoform X1 [Pecten maximus]